MAFDEFNYYVEWHEQLEDAMNNFVLKSLCLDQTRLKRSPKSTTMSVRVHQTEDNAFSAVVTDNPCGGDAFRSRRPNGGASDMSMILLIIVFS